MTFIGLNICCFNTSWVLAETDAWLFRGWVTVRLWGVFTSELFIYGPLLEALLSCRSWLFVSSVLWERQKMPLSSVYPSCVVTQGHGGARTWVTGGCRTARVKHIKHPMAWHNSWLFPPPITFFFEENDMSEWHICCSMMTLQVAMSAGMLCCWDMVVVCSNSL